jgi:hypothetical protein
LFIIIFYFPFANFLNQIQPRIKQFARPRTKQLAGAVKHGKLIDVKLFQRLAISLQFACLFLLPAIAASVAGCGRDDVKVYQVAKETPPASQPPADAPAPASAPAMAAAAIPAQTANALPQFQFALPPGWQQIAASQFHRDESFRPGGRCGHHPAPGR